MGAFPTENFYLLFKPTIFTPAVVSKSGGGSNSAIKLSFTPFTKFGLHLTFFNMNILLEKFSNYANETVW